MKENNDKHAVYFANMIDLALKEPAQIHLKMMSVLSSAAILFFSHYFTYVSMEATSMHPDQTTPTRVGIGAKITGAV